MITPYRPAKIVDVTGRTNCRLSPVPHRSGTALRGLQPALRTGLHPGDHQPALRRVDRGLRVRKAHRRAAGPSHPPRAHPGDERRELPPQGQPAKRRRAIVSAGSGGCRLASPPIPKPATASRRGAPPHRPGRGRQAPPRWYSFTPPQWHVFSPPLTASNHSVKSVSKTDHCGVVGQGKCPGKCSAKMSLRYAAMVSDVDGLGTICCFHPGGPPASR